jgi:hypothetical protein
MATQASRTDPETAPPGASIPAKGADGARAAAERAVSGNSVTVRIWDLQLELPPKDELAFLVGLGVLAALELVEWPVALAIGAGHELARSHHGKVLREFGEALEEA